MNTSNNFIHGDAVSYGKYHWLYILWLNIKARCYNSKDHAFERYGKRGIKMYTPWISNYLIFKTWILDNLGEKPMGYSLDRIRNYDNYQPGNLRWATYHEQQINSKPKKLTKKMIEEIRILLINTNLSQTEIANKFNVNQSQVSRVKRSFRYKNVCSI